MRARKVQGDNRRTAQQHYRNQRYTKENVMTTTMIVGRPMGNTTNASSGTGRIGTTISARRTWTLRKPGWISVALSFTGLWPALNQIPLSQHSDYAEAVFLHVHDNSRILSQTHCGWSRMLCHCSRCAQRHDWQTHTQDRQLQMSNTLRGRFGKRGLTTNRETCLHKLYKW